MMPFLRSSAVALALVAIAAGSAGAQRQCSTGKPCGDACIARELVCRAGAGGAVWAPGADTATAPRLIDTGTIPARASAPPSTHTPARTIDCTVERVIDGDTVVCAGGRRVRLLLVDAPELGQGEFGVHARSALQRLLPTGTAARLELDIVRTDRYRRTLAYVWLPDGRMANEELAREGFVVVSVYLPNVQHVDRIRAAVQEAQVNRRGLWSTSAFECTPARYRRGRCD